MRITLIFTGVFLLIMSVLFAVLFVGFAGSAYASAGTFLDGVYSYLSLASVFLFYALAEYFWQTAQRLVHPGMTFDPQDVFMSWYPPERGGDNHGSI